MEVQLRRSLPAPPDRVWTAFTEAADLAAWFWPSRLAAEIEADPRPGGRYRIASAVMGGAVGGEYVTVGYPDRLAFTWRWEGEELTTTVHLTLARAADGTELSLRHAGFPDQVRRDDHAVGWSDCLDRLSRQLADDGSGSPR
jgi:uncharacterized protein YndB with AHSA1/START domain